LAESLSELLSQGQATEISIKSKLFSSAQIGQSSAARRVHI